MPGPPQISYLFFPTGFFRLGFSGHPGMAYCIYHFHFFFCTSALYLLEISGVMTLQTGHDI